MGVAVAQENLISKNKQQVGFGQQDLVCWSLDLQLQIIQKYCVSCLINREALSRIPEES